MVLPPLLAGAVKAMLAWVSPGVAAPMIGAPGTVGLIVTFCVTCIAGLKLALPDWVAAMVQVPVETMLTVAPLMLQTLGVVDA